MNNVLTALAVALVVITPAQAEEIRLLSAAAMQTVFKDLGPDFERASGHRLVIVYRTMGGITEQVLKGESADVVISSSLSMARLAREGRIEPQSRLEIARVGVGMVVPAGSAQPAVASVEEFRRALLGAKLIVYADPAGGGAAGVHIAKLIEKLGLGEELRPKTKYGTGGDVTEVTLALGEGAFGMTQISEIVDKPGARFLGP